MRELSREQRERLARAGLLFGIVAPLTYMAERIYERLKGGRIDPAAILQEAHTTFYWRTGIALWFGLVVAVAFYARGTQARWLGWGLAALPVVMTFLAWRFP